jgi:hypothetical protein
MPKVRTASGDVASSEGHAALGTNEVESAEVVLFAKRLLFPVCPFNWEELGRDHLATVLCSYIRLTSWPIIRSELTKHLKQLRWNTVPKARTKGPCIGFPQAEHDLRINQNECS